MRIVGGKGRCENWCQRGHGTIHESGQPWLDNEHMWTIDDIAERKITIKDPLDEVEL